MSLPPSLVERAYQLAESGEYGRVSDISARLAKEGYVNVRSHLQGRALHAALRQACAEAARRAPPLQLDRP